MPLGVSLSCVHPGITHHDTKLRHQPVIFFYLRSSWITTWSADIRISLGPSFFGFGHYSDPFRPIQIILGSIWLIFDIGDMTFFGDTSYHYQWPTTTLSAITADTYMASLSSMILLFWFLEYDSVSTPSK